MPNQPTTWEERFRKEFPQLYHGYLAGTFAERIESFISGIRKEAYKNGYIDGAKEAIMKRIIEDANNSGETL